MTIKDKFLFHGTPNAVDRTNSPTVKPGSCGKTFTTDDLNCGRCYTIEDNVMITWDNGKYHVILTKEPDDLDRPGYVYQIPTAGMDFQDSAYGEFVTTNTHKLAGPNAVVRGVRELIEDHDVQVYIIPEGADPKTFIQNLDCPSVVTMQGYLCNLGCRHLNAEWRHNTGAKTNADFVP